MSDRRIRTYTGRLVDPFNPQAEDLCSATFIHAICNINRFTGHARHPYSVGQHTRNLVWAVPPHLKRAALMHDFSEAWFNDLASPVKAAFPDYAAAEKRAGLFIASALGVSHNELREVDRYDKAIYINERDALFHVAEQGVGDDRIGLPVYSPSWFKETEWRVVRGYLMSTFRTLFPEIVW